MRNQTPPEGRQPRFQPGQQVRSRMGAIWTIDQEGGKWNNFWHDFNYKCTRYNSTGTPLRHTTLLERECSPI